MCVQNWSSRASDAQVAVKLTTVKWWHFDVPHNWLPGIGSDSCEQQASPQHRVVCNMLVLSALGESQEQA